MAGQGDANMKPSFAAALILGALVLAGCAGTAPPPADPHSAEFKSNRGGPPGLARVYLLPTYSKGLFRDLEGRAAFAIFPEGSEHGARLGETSKGSFVAFDIGPGNYDLMAYGDDPLTRVTKPMEVEAGKAYFLRPAFFRAAKELSANPAEIRGGMGFDQVPASDAAAELTQLEMASLNPEGRAFLDRTVAAERPRPGGLPTPAAAVVPHPPTVQPVPPAPVAASPAAPMVSPQDTAPVKETAGDSFAVIERKLRELKQLRQQGLITQQDYDGKRKAILNAY